MRDLAPDEPVALEEVRDVGPGIAGQLPRVAGEELGHELDVTLSQLSRGQLSVGQLDGHGRETLFSRAVPEIRAHEMDSPDREEIRRERTRGCQREGGPDES